MIQLKEYRIYVVGKGIDRGAIAELCHVDRRLGRDEVIQLRQESINLLGYTNSAFLAIAKQLQCISYCNYV